MKKLLLLSLLLLGSAAQAATFEKDQVKGVLECKQSVLSYGTVLEALVESHKNTFNDMRSALSMKTFTDGEAYKPFGLNDTAAVLAKRDGAYALGFSTRDSLGAIAKAYGVQEGDFKPLTQAETGKYTPPKVAHLSQGRAVVVFQNQTHDALVFCDAERKINIFLGK